MTKIIDLRSDTVTQPSNKMRDAISNSLLGDDVFGEDPTVNEIEQKAAQIMGKESALLVPSGTMGNLVSILSHCERGTEIILGHKSHTFIYEGGGISSVGGIHSRQLLNDDFGIINLDDIKQAVRDDNVHYPKTSAISLENTHNMCFGSPIEPNYIKSVSVIAKENNLKLHIDGARIFNAAVSLNIDVKDFVKNVDSVTFCLSKGLAAPIGSVVCGSKKFIDKARRHRKGLGGGMRQAGIIAAAGLISLDDCIMQIKKDHNNAKVLAEGLNKIKGLSVQLNLVQTNIIFFKLESDEITAQALVESMNSKGIKFFETSPNRFRLVTHYGITKKDIYKTLIEFDKCLN
ncbi:MAG: low-specificity L-threonine aldolase [Candidatus Marinimicrobia bacterium]|nr:low-specificity L-threonine aldolase [Candidatus Neomarinimicrobiota bacterium]